MAARKTKGTKDVPWSEATRGRIRTSMLLNRLHDHVVGTTEMAQSQVNAAKILLDKVLPNLSAQELSGGVANYVARLPEPAKTAADWEASLPARGNTCGSPGTTEQAPKPKSLN